MKISFIADSQGGWGVGGLQCWSISLIGSSRGKGRETILYRWKVGETLSLYTYDKLLFKLLETGLGKRSFQKNATFSHSFAFFKKSNILAFFCILYKKNATFFAFFYILYKRTLPSLRSCTFFIKERCILLHSL